MLSEEVKVKKPRGRPRLEKAKRSLQIAVTLSPLAAKKYLEMPEGQRSQIISLMIEKNRTFTK